MTLASEKGNTEIANYLIENGADTSKLTIVDWVNLGWLQKVKESRQNGVNPNQRVQAPYDDGRGTIEKSRTLLIS